MVARLVAKTNRRNFVVIKRSLGNSHDSGQHFSPYTSAIVFPVNRFEVVSQCD
jgi:hypothetical protein